jgi:hypothetical protein
MPKINIYFLKSQALVAHAYNPSYSRGRDQEDHSSKPAQANSSWDLLSWKNPSQKRAGGVAQSIGPEFEPQYHKRKKESNLMIKYIHSYTAITTIHFRSFSSLLQRNPTLFSHHPTISASLPALDNN